MVDVETGSVAVDPPMPYVAPGTRARRHRSLTGLSGILLFACMFLPAVQGCNHPVIPYEVPPLLPPYLYGLVFALIAMSWSPRRLAGWVIALRLLAALIVAASVGLFVLVPPVGALELLVGTILLLIVAPGTTERRIASTGVAVGLISVIWFGFWSATPDALLGVYLSFASSIGLFLGSVAWLRDLSRGSGIEMPRAVAARAAAATRRVGGGPGDILAG